MKKFLLATTALVGFAASAQAGGGHMPAEAAPAPANTGGITVMVGGNIAFEASATDQDNNAGITDRSAIGGASATGTAGDTRDVHFTNPNTEINITAAGSTENFDYGAVVELNADIDEDVEGDGGNADKTYLFAESDNFGRVELGANTGAEGALEVDASNIARATGGIDGNWWHYVDTDGVSSTAGADLTSSVFSIKPNLVLDNNEATTQDATKITYYTPRFSGLQLGVSYVPDSGDIGSGANLSLKNNGDAENVFTGGVNYEANMEGVGLTLAAVGETGEAEATGTEDLNAYSLGGKVEVAGFSVAGNWADQGDSLSAVGSDTESTYWTAGAAYENGPAGVSVTYFNGERDATGTANDTETTNLVVGADYQLAPGFTPYVEAAFFELEDGAAGTQDNDGSVVLLGAELSF
ncbi:MAG TPA: hypothetical protein DIV86_05240 [Alphaproteobacteria bacterium]|nr:hypothetical protein [Alphaproteobacteria bacterium]